MKMNSSRKKMNTTKYETPFKKQEPYICGTVWYWNWALDISPNPASHYQWNNKVCKKLIDQINNKAWLGKTLDTKHHPKVFTNINDIVFPIFAKPIRGSQGKGVQFITNQKDLTKLNPKLYIFQQAIINPILTKNKCKVDYRVFIAVSNAWVIVTNICFGRTAPEVYDCKNTSNRVQVTNIHLHGFEDGVFVDYLNESEMKSIAQACLPITHLGAFRNNKEYIILGGDVIFTLNNKDNTRKPWLLELNPEWDRDITHPAQYKSQTRGLYSLLSTINGQENTCQPCVRVLSKK